MPRSPKARREERRRPKQYGFAFGVGFNNFATGRGEMEQLVARAQRQLSDTEIVAWYGATGNFALRSDLSNSELARALEQAFKRNFAVVSRSQIERVISTSDSWRRPVRARWIRWTPGVAFRVAGPPPPARPDPTNRGRFRRVNDHAVLVQKRDIETPEGRLDSARRQGGWGAISADIARQTGGSESVWTARSLRAILGLRARVEDYG
jgi:hypothetical protein